MMNDSSLTRSSSCTTTITVPRRLSTVCFFLLLSILVGLVGMAAGEKPPGAIIEMGNVNLGKRLHNTIANDVVFINNAQHALVDVDGILLVVQFANQDINNVTQYPSTISVVGKVDALGAKVLFCEQSDERGLLFCLLDHDTYPIAAVRTTVKQRGQTFLEVSRFHDVGDRLTNASFATPYRGARLTSYNGIALFIVYGYDQGYTIFNVTDEQSMGVVHQNTTALTLGLSCANTEDGLEMYLQLDGPGPATTIERLNITDPTNPVTISTLISPAFAMRAVDRGCFGFDVVNTAWLKYPVVAMMGCMNISAAGNVSYIYVYDVQSTPMQSFYPSSSTGRVKATSKSTMYRATAAKNNRFVQTLPDKKYVVACAGSVVSVVDIFQPDKPRLVIEHSLPGINSICAGLSTSGSILAVAYTTAGVGVTTAMVSFYRLQDFTSLQNSVWEVTGSQTLKVDMIRGMWTHTDNSKEYVTTGSSTNVQMINFDDKTSPSLATTNNSGVPVTTRLVSQYAVYAFESSNDILYTAEFGLRSSRMIRAWDVTGGSDPTTTADRSLDIGGSVAGLAHVANKNDILLIFPASGANVFYVSAADPNRLSGERPVKVTFPSAKLEPTGNWYGVPQPINDGDNTIAAAYNSDRKLYFFKDTGFVGLHEAPCSPTAMRFNYHGERLYLACKNVLYVIGIYYQPKRGTTAFKFIARQEFTTSTILDMVESNDYTALYLAAGKDGLVVVDISNIGVPLVLGALRTSGAVARVETYGHSDLNTIYIAERSVVRTVTVRTDYFCLATVNNNYFNAPATTTLATVSVGEAITGFVKVFNKNGVESSPSWVDSMSGVPTFLTVDESTLAVSGTPTKTYEGEKFIVKIKFSVETEDENGDFTTESYKCWSYFNVVSSLNVYEYYSDESLNKVRIASPSSILSLKITLINVTSGRFVTSPSATAAYGATVLSFDQDTGTLSVLGSLADVNKMLGLLRFSVDDEALAESNVTVLVDDTINNVRKWSTNLTIFSKNIGPSLNTSRPLRNFTFDQGKSFNIFLDTDAFVDPDDELTYSVQMADGSPLPNWVVFYSDRHEFRGASDVEQTVEVEVTANDNYKTASAVFTITIANPAPRLHVGNVTWNTTHGIAVKLGNTRIFQFPEELFTDDDDIMYSVAAGGGATLPSWVQFDAATRQLTLAGPQATDRFEIVYSAKDGFKETSLRVNISAVNTPPIVVSSLDNVRIKLGSKFTHVLRVDSTFSDGDDAMLHYSIAGLPSFATFDASSRTIAGTASEKSNTTVTVTASDGFASVSTTFGIEVYNAPPRLAKLLQNVVGKTGQTFTHGVEAGTFTDDDDVPIYTIHQVKDVRGVPAVLPSTIYFDALNLRLSGKADADVWLNITIRASDGFEFADGHLSLNITNSPPIVVAAIPSETHKLGVAMTVKINRTAVEDADDKRITFTVFEVSSSGFLLAIPRWLLWDAVNLQLTGAPQVEEALTFEMQASDGYASTSTRFTLTFVDQAPTVTRSIPHTRIKVGQTLDLKVKSHFRDRDDPALSYKFTMMPSRTWLNFDAANTKFYGVPDLPSGETASRTALARDYAEVFNITVEASDGFKSVTTSFLLTAFDNAPRINGTLGEFKVKALTDISWSVPNTAFYDPDEGDQLIITAAGLPSFAAFESRLQTVVGNAPISNLGTSFVVSFTASDGHKAVTTNWKLRIMPNTAPTLTRKFEDVIWYVNEDNSYPVPTNQFEDPDGDALKLSAALVDDASVGTEKALDNWMLFDSARGVLTGKPNDDALGWTEVIISAADPYGEVVKGKLRIESKRSVLEVLKYAFEWFGIVTAIIGPLIGIYGLWTGIVNIWKGKSVMVGLNPFDKATGTYTLEAPFEKIESVKAYRRDEGYGCMKAFCHHWYNLLTLTPLKNSVDLPDWLIFEQLGCELRVDPTAILPAETALVVLVTDGSGVVLSEIDVDPQPILEAQSSGLTALATSAVTPKLPSSALKVPPLASDMETPLLPAEPSPASRLHVPEQQTHGTTHEDIFLEEELVTTSGGNPIVSHANPKNNAITNDGIDGAFML